MYNKQKENHLTTKKFNLKFFKIIFKKIVKTQIIFWSLWIF